MPSLAGPRPPPDAIPARARGPVCAVISAVPGMPGAPRRDTARHFLKAPAGEETLTWPSFPKEPN